MLTYKYLSAFHFKIPKRWCFWFGKLFKQPNSSDIGMSDCNTIQFNSMWPNDAIWWHISGSTLVLVMVCCLTAPSHYLNQCWLIVSMDQWRLSKCNFTRDTPAIKHEISASICLNKISFKSPRGQWVKLSSYTDMAAVTFWKKNYTSVPNYCQSVSPKQTILEEDWELFSNFTSILCLWFEIQGSRTDNFIDWVLNTDYTPHLGWSWRYLLQ